MALRRLYDFLVNASGDTSGGSGALVTVYKSGDQSSADLYGTRVASTPLPSSSFTCLNTGEFPDSIWVEDGEYDLMIVLGGNTVWRRNLVVGTGEGPMGPIITNPTVLSDLTQVQVHDPSAPPAERRKWVSLSAAVSKGLLGDAGPTVNMEREKDFALYPGITATEATTRLQAAMDYHRAQNGSAKFLLPRFPVPINRPILWWDVIDLESPHKTEAGFMMASDFVGGTILSNQPTIGRPVGRLIQNFRNMRLNGMGVYRYPGTGVTVKGTNQVVKCNFTNGQPPIGSLFEATGTLPLSKVTAIVNAGDGTWTVTLDKINKYTNSADGVTPKATRWRKTLSLICSTTAGSKKMLISAGDRAKVTAGVAAECVGWRVDGDVFGLEGDETTDPGLRNFTRVTAIDRTTWEVTLDDVAETGSAAFILTMWAEPNLVTWQTARDLPNYNDDWEYAGCDMIQVQGRGGAGVAFQARIGRHQLRFADSKADQMDRAAFHVGGCNDIAMIQCGASSWDTCATIRSGATPKIIKGEYYLPGRLDGPKVLDMSGMNECNVSDTDFNGPVRVATVAGQTTPSVTFKGCNMKWFRENTSPDPELIQSMVHINRGILVWDGGILKEAQVGKPEHLKTGSGTLWVRGVPMITDVNDPRCPWKTSISDNPASVILDYIDFETKQATMGHGQWTPALSSVTNGASLEVTYSDQRGYWTMMPGGRVELTVFLTGVVTGLGSPAAAGNLRLVMPAGVTWAPRAGFGGQRIPAAIEGTGWALGTDFICNAFKVTEGGQVAIWKTGTNKTPVEATVGNLVIGQEFTLLMMGSLIV